MKTWHLLGLWLIAHTQPLCGEEATQTTSRIQASCLAGDAGDVDIASECAHLDQFELAISGQRFSLWSFDIRWRYRGLPNLRSWAEHHDRPSYASSAQGVALFSVSRHWDFVEATLETWPLNLSYDEGFLSFSMSTMWAPQYWQQLAVRLRYKFQDANVSAIVGNGEGELYEDDDSFGFYAGEGFWRLDWLDMFFRYSIDDDHRSKNLASYINRDFSENRGFRVRRIDAVVATNGSQPWSRGLRVGALFSQQSAEDASKTTSTAEAASASSHPQWSFFDTDGQTSGTHRYQYLAVGATYRILDTYVLGMSWTDTSFAQDEVTVTTCSQNTLASCQASLDGTKKWNASAWVAGFRAEFLTGFVWSIERRVESFDKLYRNHGPTDSERIAKERTLDRLTLSYQVGL